MADARKIHPQAGMDAKVSALSHLEFRVWFQTVCSVNDCGIMPASARKLQGDNLALDRLPTKSVQKALEQVIGVGIYLTFTQEATSYIWSAKWQDWQQIRHPRRSPYPFPSDTSKASPDTLKLFARYVELHGKTFVPVPQNFGNSTEEFLPRVRADHAPARNPTPTANANSRDPGEESARETTALQPGNPHSRPSNLVNGAEILKHSQHAWCSWPARDGFCITWNYHNQVLARSLKPATEVLEFYKRTMAEMEGIPIGDPLFTFWDNKVNAWLGNATAKPNAKRQYTDEELQAPVKW